MSDTNASAGSGSSSGDKALFWGCFIALITTAFGFITRLFLIGTWAGEFKLDPAQAGRLAGIGIWPFAVSIIAFSLFIDRIGYKVAMIMAFVGHIVWTIMGVSAYWERALQGGIILCAVAIDAVRGSGLPGFRGLAAAAENPPAAKADA